MTQYDITQYETLKLFSTKLLIPIFCVNKKKYKKKLIKTIHISFLNSVKSGR